MRDALVEVFGTTGPIGGYSFAGRTDPEIVRHLMRGAGFADADIDERMPEVFRRYVAKLEREIVGVEVTPLPGVPELVDRMEAEGIVSSANHVGKREVLVSSRSEAFNRNGE